MRSMKSPAKLAQPCLVHWTRQREKHPPPSNRHSAPWCTVNGAIDSFDKEVGIQDTLGSLVLAGSDLANQLATKVVELNDEYKVTDQLKSKIDDALASSKS
eukprot:symbB.v1.2.012924.t1/scaffold903.1/size153517/11